MRETIEKEVRLSYLERIQQSLPEQYSQIFPRKVGIEEWKPISGTLDLSKTKRDNETDLADRFGGGDEGSEKLIEALRSKDEPSISNYVETTPNCGEVLVAAMLYVSHETPYTYSIPPTTLELVKKHTTPSSLIGTIMSFWKERPSTGFVLVMKYVDLGAITLNDIISWLHEQDSWMSKSWGWDIVQICNVKAKSLATRLQKASDVEPVDINMADENTTDGNAKKMDESGDAMEVDIQTATNGTTSVGNEWPELLKQIIAGVGPCYIRQNEWDQYWLKEWLAMVVRKANEEVAGLEGDDWVGEMLASAEKHRRRLV